LTVFGNFRPVRVTFRGANEGSLFSEGLTDFCLHLRVLIQLCLFKQGAGFLEFFQVKVVDANLTVEYISQLSSLEGNSLGVVAGISVGYFNITISKRTNQSHLAIGNVAHKQG
jgi:hypothetical protein